jgi:hypothetical protein
MSEILENVDKQKKQQQATVSDWKTFSARVKLQDVPLLVQRLKIYGYHTLNELVIDFIAAKFPPQLLTISKSIDCKPIWIALANPH